MNKLMSTLYAGACYVVFLVAFLYSIAFVGNLHVPWTIDRVGGPAWEWSGVLIDACLLGAFALQHSVMARRSFKEWWTKLVPAHLERSTYVLITSVLLLAIFRLWVPLTSSVWQFDSALGKGLSWSVFALGWLVVLTSTFMIDHFDLFGLRQVYLYLKGRGPRPPEFRTHFLYGLVRHPIMSGFIIAFWATPAMTAGHLLFAVATTGYILVGTRLEEKDLVRDIREPYEEYRRQVPALVPRLTRKG